MIHLASTVLAMGDTPDARALQHKLLDGSYTAPFFHSGAEALDCARKTRPDVVIIGPGLSDMGCDALVEQLRTDPATITVPIFMLSNVPLADNGDHLLTLGIDDAIGWPADPATVAQRLRSTVRLSTMRVELSIRRSVANAALTPLDVDGIHIDRDEPPTVMVIGTESVADAVQSCLSADLKLTRCEDLFEAQRQIEEQRFDACVVSAGSDLEPAMDLCLQIRRNPRLFNLPVIMVCQADQAAVSPRALNMGASHVMTMPLAVAEMRFVLQTLVRRQRVRWAIRQALAITRTPAVSAPGVRDAYSSAFLSDYLDCRIAQAQQNQRQFSVVGFSFAGVDAIRHEFGTEAESHLLDQIGQWLSLLVRAEDLVAHLGGARFCVTLPDTPPSEAQVVMHRIAGVISNTDFAVADVYRVVNVWPYVNAFGLTAVDTASSILQAVSTLDAGGGDFA
jgi:two-component system cell cycle response regulator